MLTHLSLFSGIAGTDLAAEWAGFETVCFVEIDKFCQKVLRKHWPDVPIVEDIRHVTKEKVMAYAKEWQDDKRNRGIILEAQGRGAPGYASIESSSSDGQRLEARATAHSPITLITGGFPCQPVSVAGKRRGKEDDRWLWPEMFRVVSEVRPAWVVAENVAGLARMGLNDCLSDLEGEGFEVTTFLIPACAVNAPHRRDRIFIVAHSKGKRLEGRGDREGRLNEESERLLSARPNKCEDVAHAKQQQQNWWPNGSGRWSREPLEALRDARLRGGQEDGVWLPESLLGRVAHGIPSRVDRLRALGNAVVPQQIYPILKAIAEIERVKHGG